MAEHKRLVEAVEDYITFRRARFATATAENEAFVLRRFAAWYTDVQIRSMTAEKVALWFYGPDGVRQPHVTRDRVHRQPVAATTANYYRTRLASFFRWATQRGWLRLDLLAEVLPLPVTRRKRFHAPPAMLLGLLDVTDNARDRAFVALIINTGFRAGTVTRIRVGDLDLVGGAMKVAITKTHEEDWFPITGDLEPELRSWLQVYARDLGRTLREDDFLLPARRGSVYHWQDGADGTRVRTRTRPSWVPEKPVTHPERIVQQALRAVGAPTLGEGVHTVRRSVARAFFDSMSNTTGHDGALRTTSALLHHSSSVTTETYLGLTGETQRRDVMLRGQPFLSALVDLPDNVTPLRRAAGG